MPDISRRGRLMPQSPIRRLSAVAAEARRRGIDVIPFNIGQPDLPAPPGAIEALHGFESTMLPYSPSEGIASLRAKLAGYYRRWDIDVDPSEIIVTTGGSEAVMMAFLSCLDPGDEIIVPEPAYANYMAFAVLAGARIVPLPTSIEDGFRLPSADEIERCVTERTRAVLICNPNNPTGTVYTRAQLEEVAEVVRRHNLFLFSDEVYREFCYDGEGVYSALRLEGIERQTVLIDSVSKRYSECGIRIGALVTRNSELRAAVMKFCQARLSPPLLGQIAAEASIEGNEDYLAAAFEEYRSRRDYLIGGLNAIPGVYAPMPQGAFYTLVDLPVDDADHFCRWALESFSHEGKTVFLAPASGFYSEPERGRSQARMAYVIEKPRLEEGLLTLRKALEAYNAR